MPVENPIYQPISNEQFKVIYNIRNLKEFLCFPTMFAAVANLCMVSTEADHSRPVLALNPGGRGQNMVS